MSHRYQLVPIIGTGQTHEERWAGFCATVTARIEEIRRDQPPICSSCNAESSPPVDYKRCPKCGFDKPVKTAFSKDLRKRRTPYQSWCRSCKAAQLSDLRRRKALDGLRRAS